MTSPNFEQESYSDHRSRYILIYPWKDNRTHIIVKQGATWNRTPIYQAPTVSWPVGNLVGAQESALFAQALTLATSIAEGWAKDTGKKVTGT